MAFDSVPRTYRSSTYRNPDLNMMAQPIPPPVSRRTDRQRVLLGNQFNGEIPDDDPGEESQVPAGDDPAPTEGGRWMYSGDVVVTRIRFYTPAGADPGPRAAGSGIFVRGKRSLTDRLLYSLAGALEDVTITDPIVLNQGDILKVITVGATLEMIVDVDVEHISSRRGS